MWYQYIAKLCVQFWQLHTRYQSAFYLFFALLTLICCIPRNEVFLYGIDNDFGSCSALFGAASFCETGHQFYSRFRRCRRHTLFCSGVFRNLNLHLRSLSDDDKNVLSWRPDRVVWGRRWRQKRTLLLFARSPDLTRSRLLRCECKYVETSGYISWRRRLWNINRMFHAVSTLHETVCTSDQLWITLSSTLWSWLPRNHSLLS